ncbi:MAG: 2'-5' RNA ligase family protein [Sphingobacteriales bacterium]|nr:2'-5' RNA ligase family protein [Sphingobacteriales bacterium]
MKGLYFIAIVPPKEIAECIHEIRLAFAEKFHSEEALKSPIHLTLKEPFTMDIKEEIILRRKLSFIATQHQPFQHRLNNYGRFQKHAIFIQAEKHPFLVALKSSIRKMFRANFYHVQQDQMPFNPHYTIAYRDISEQVFEKAFAEYEHKKFFAELMCNEFTLFKHDGKQWQNMEDFKLCGLPEITLFDEKTPLSTPNIEKETSKVETLNKT